MGDVSSEPTMEEILSSIKRVIEESDGPAAPRRRVPRPIASQAEDEVLELNDPAPMSPGHADDPAQAQVEARVPPAEPQPVASRTAQSQPAQSQPEASASAPRVSDRFVDRMSAAQRDGAPGHRSGESLVSPSAEQASREPLAALSRMIVRPDVAGSDTLEGMVREMLRPMLRDWLDANLPAIVETMVSREIARISGREG